MNWQYILSIYHIYWLLVSGDESNNCYHDAIIEDIQGQDFFSEVLKSCRKGDEFNECRLLDVNIQNLEFRRALFFHNLAIPRFEKCVNEGDSDSCLCLLSEFKYLFEKASEIPGIWFKELILCYYDYNPQLTNADQRHDCIAKVGSLVEVMKRHRKNKQQENAIFMDIASKINECPESNTASVAESNRDD